MKMMVHQQLDPNMGSSSFHILDGSVILTPNKGFESDTDSSSGSESDSTSNSDEEIAYDDDTKYVQLHTLYSYFELKSFLFSCFRSIKFFV